MPNFYKPNISFLKLFSLKWPWLVMAPRHLYISKQMLSGRLSLNTEILKIAIYKMPPNIRLWFFKKFKIMHGYKVPWASQLKKLIAESDRQRFETEELPALEDKDVWQVCIQRKIITWEWNKISHEWLWIFGKNKTHEN